MNADICAEFPLFDMVHFHKNLIAARASSHPHQHLVDNEDDDLGVTTILGTEATPTQVCFVWVVQVDTFRSWLSAPTGGNGETSSFRRL